jgi:RNA polymerase sigma-70 factor (ECF subfamily)
MSQRDSIALDFGVWPAEDALGRQPMDESAFRALYSGTAPKLLAYIRRASGNATLADDILQETFYRFLRTNPPTMELAPTKAYLYRIASALLADHWRQAKRERLWGLANVFRNEWVEAARESGDAMSAYASLKPQEQSLLWLAYVEGFDHREIAAALDLKEGSIRVLLFRARKKLAGLLRKRGLTLEEAL